MTPRGGYHGDCWIGAKKKDKTIIYRIDAVKRNTLLHAMIVNISN